MPRDRVLTEASLTGNAAQRMEIFILYDAIGTQLGQEFLCAELGKSMGKAHI